MSYRTQMQLKEKYTRNQSMTEEQPVQQKQPKQKAQNNLFKCSSSKQNPNLREVSRQSSEVRNDYLHNMTINSGSKTNNSRIDVY